MSENRVWTIEVVFTEDEDRTRADAHLHAGGRDLAGWGAARRHPADPDVPLIGEELAAARALSQLVHRLVYEAEEHIATREGHAVTLHL
ncbi:MAG TPA: DUF1876 domain-containing protein [Acidimicrobiales bacterium]|nr:DUF1876 domain-containing protein [Acidimicrobiales bacterium]